MPRKREVITKTITDQDGLEAMSMFLQHEILDLESQIKGLREVIVKKESLISIIRNEGKYTYTIESNVK